MRQRPVRSGGSGRPDRMMWVVRSDEGGDGRTKMGTNPDRCHWDDDCAARCSGTGVHDCWCDTCGQEPWC